MTQAQVRRARADELPAVASLVAAQGLDGEGLPAAVHGSGQLRGACPATARALLRPAAPAHDTAGTPTSGGVPARQP